MGTDRVPSVRASEHLTRAVWILVGVSLATALVATLAFVVATLPVRVPYWGEAEVVFEASRLRAHLPLYVDPLVGAHEYGEPPSRFYVTYPPLWTALVALLPRGAALIASRVLATTAWFGSLAGVVLGARRSSRLDALAAAAFVAGIWVLANFATIGRPDSLACALAALALLRAVTKGEVDFVSAALFVLVPWVKPTLIGLPLGAFVGGWLASGRRAWRAIAFAGVLACASVIVAHVASAGALLAHVVRSNAQPFTLTAWLDQVPSRLPFFGPLFAWAAWVGWRERDGGGARIGLAALGGAVLWTVFALAKTGSSSNYWMEPCVAAVVLISRSASGLGATRGSLRMALAALVAVAWADVASVRAALEHTRSMRADAAFVDSVRSRCDLSPGDVIAADEAGIELVINERILVPTYQMVHLARRGLYPTHLWASDLGSPRTRCFVEHTGQLGLVPELESALAERYAVVASEGGFRLWKKRP